MPINDTWEKIFQQRWWGMQASEHLIQLLRDFKPEKALELGCGTGGNLWYLASKGIEFVGIDGAPSGISRAQQFLDDQYPGWKGELRVGDIIKLPYKKETFDLVFDVEAISANSLEDAAIMFGEAARVLKPGGRFLTVFFSEDTCKDFMKTETLCLSQEQLREMIMPHFSSARYVKSTCHHIGNNNPAQYIREWVIEAIK